MTQSKKPFPILRKRNQCFQRNGWAAAKKFIRTSRQAKKDLDEFVQKQVDNLPAKVDEKIDKKIEDIWKEVYKTYKNRIFVIFSIAVAALVVLFSFFTIKATTTANQSVIEFQNGIIERQKTVIESEENISVVNGRLLEAEGKFKG